MFIFLDDTGLVCAKMSNSPRVWSKFSSRNKNGEIFNFRIIDLPIDRYYNFTELFVNCFAKEERTYVVSGVPQSAEALEEVSQMLLDKRHDRTTKAVICCLDNDDDEVTDIIGASVMLLGTREEIIKKMLPPQIKSEALKKRYEVVSGLWAAYDSIKEFNQDRYFFDRGLCVRADYRGLGIAQELFKVRRLMCKENGIARHGAWMTSYGTQKAAEREGWESVCEIQDVDYDKNGPPTWKFMVLSL